jgi:hypothetical protein
MHPNGSDRDDMRTTDFITRLETEMPGQHRVLAPLGSAELERWLAKWPRKLMPEDLLLLLQQANGIQFWVSEGSPQGYLRLLSLRDIDSAREAIWGEHSREMAPEDLPYPLWLAVGVNQDQTSYVVLDTDSQRYYLMDSCSADLNNPVGESVEHLLDYVWKDWVKGLHLTDAA